MAASTNPVPTLNTQLCVYVDDGALWELRIKEDGGLWWDSEEHQVRRR
jgi:hypothetical protein